MTTLNGLRKMKRFWGLVALATTVSACASTPAPQVYQSALPSAQPVRSITGFSDSLTCMDDMLYSYGIRDIRLTTNGIPDATGEIQTGTRDMLISAVSRMSQRSRAFTYIDFEEVTTGFAAPADRRLYERQQSMLTPTYYIRGAVTMFDDSVTNDTAGAGIRMQGTGFGINTDATSSVVGVDMNVGEVATGLIVPGAAASNRIAVTRRTKALDSTVDLKVDGEVMGAFLQGAHTKAEGMHTAVRSLIELNTIETLGKLTRTPYWRCLGVPQTDPASAKRAFRYFDAMDETNRIDFVQRSMHSLGLYSGPIDGKFNPQLAEAVGAYQAKHSLVASGRIDAQLYSSLLGQDMKLEGLQTVSAGSGPSFQKQAQEQLYISLTDVLEFPTYKAGMPLQMKARLNADAYLYCFYQDGAGSISRIFPNRFQPNALVEGGKVVQVPAEGSGFKIVFEQPGAKENIACAASRTEFGPNLPASLRQDDLTPLPVKTLTELEKAVRAVAPTDLAFTRLEFLIR